MDICVPNNVHAEHAIAALPQVRELNIGHAIIADSVFMGLEKTVQAYKAIMQDARR